jgi:predicted lipoprotein
MRNPLAAMFNSFAALLLAAAPALADVYQGTGQVVSGPGAGATVSMTVDYDGQNLRVVSGPSLEGSQVRVDHRGNVLDLTVFRGQHVIRYHLLRTGR